MLLIQFRFVLFLSVLVIGGSAVYTSRVFSFVFCLLDASASS